MPISLPFLLQTVLFIYSALQLQVCLIKSVQFRPLKHALARKNLCDLLTPCLPSDSRTAVDNIWVMIEGQKR